MVTIGWVLYALIYLIGNRAKIGLFFLILLFDFIAECGSYLLRYISAKFIIDSIIVSEILVLP